MTQNGHLVLLTTIIVSIVQAKNLGNRIPFFDSFATFATDITPSFTASLSDGDYKILDEVAEIGPRDQLEAIDMIRERNDYLADKVATLYEIVDTQIDELKSTSAKVFIRNLMVEAEAVGKKLTLMNVDSDDVKKHSITVAKAFQALPTAAQAELIELFPDMVNLSKGKICWTGANVRRMGFIGLCRIVGGASLL